MYNTRIVFNEMYNPQKKNEWETIIQQHTSSWFMIKFVLKMKKIWINSVPIFIGVLWDFDFGQLTLWGVNGFSPGLASFPPSSTQT